MTPAKKKPAPPKAFRDREIERSLQEAVSLAGDVLVKYFGRLKGYERKGAVDLVTRADRESEARVIDYLTRRHPAHAIMAEESWRGGREIPSGICWIIDPLDGTTNYAHGLEHHAVSIAVAVDGEPVAGVVFDPHRGHFFRAIRGRGAFCGRKRLRVSTVARLADALLVTGFPYDRRKRIEELMSLFGAFLKRAQGVRRYGSASLDLAYVASGRFEGYYEPRLHPWDVAAGALLVSEAGGKVTDFQGRPFHIFSDSYVAAPSAIHRAMLRVVRSTYKALEAGEAR